MISSAFIEEYGTNQMEPEMCDVYTELLARNIAVSRFTLKRIQRQQIPFTVDTLVVGYVSSVLAALRQLGIEAPPTNDYPLSLRHLLHRRVWETTVRQLLEWAYENRSPVFAKPYGQKKRFTGRVFSGSEAIQYLAGVSQTLPILCSEVIDWISEYRVFVLHGEIISIRHYAGNPAIPLDTAIATEAVKTLQQTNEATAGYALDLGVTANGETALVEWNDGFSLGSYGLDKSLYTDLLIARWCELTTCGV